MSNPSDSIIERWNRSFRGWSQEYIKPHKAAIITNCLFENKEQQSGHSSALRDIEKNKGNIRQFVSECTDQQQHHLLPSKILSDSYVFDRKKSEYELVYRSVIGDFISWKPGTSNALSRWPLSVDVDDEHFACKFRKYQLESMKKFVQATPGTKEIRGQWSVNLADDALTVSFHDGDVVLMLKIGCFVERLHVMHRENAVLRKNSKMRKQTLKTSCWGLEKTRFSVQFENSIVIQENHSIEIDAENVLSISPLMVYVKRDRIRHLRSTVMTIGCGPELAQTVNLGLRPFEIREIQITSLSMAERQRLGAKYRESMLSGTVQRNHSLKIKANRTRNSSLNRKRKLKAVSGSRSGSRTRSNSRSNRRTQHDDHDDDDDDGEEEGGNGGDDDDVESTVDDTFSVHKIRNNSNLQNIENDDDFCPKKPKRMRYHETPLPLQPTLAVHHSESTQSTATGTDTAYNNSNHTTVSTPYIASHWSPHHGAQQAPPPSMTQFSPFGPTPITPNCNTLPLQNTVDSQPIFASQDTLTTPLSPSTFATLTPRDPFEWTTAPSTMPSVNFHSDFGALSGSNDLNSSVFGTAVTGGSGSAHSESTGYQQPAEDEVQRLRRQNAFLMRTLAEQRQQIEYLSARMQAAVPLQQSTAYYPVSATVSRPQATTMGSTATALKQCGLSPDTLLPPAA